MPETDCDRDCVPQGDAVKDTDTVPHELADADEQVVDEPDGLTVMLLEDVADELYDADTVGDDDSVVEIVGEVDNVVEMVDDEESVPEPDCDMECVPLGDAVKEPEVVPHELAEADEQMVGEPDTLTVPLRQLVDEEL